MGKLLDSLKETVEDAVFWNHALVMDGKIATITIDELRRLIEIVEGAEWAGWSVSMLPCCTLCGNFSEYGHTNDCPYSDEWKGKEGE